MTKLVGFSGAFWTFMERAGQQVIKVVFTVVLARLLSPSDYGIVAVLYIFSAFSTLLINGGISQTIILKEHISPKEKSTFFYYTTAIGLFVYTILTVSSGQIAVFFDSHILTEIAPVYFLSFVFQGMYVVPESMLYRDLKFKYISYTNLLSYSISGSFSIILAVNGLGVWSLILQSVSQALLKCLFVFRYNGWFPSLKFNYETILETRKFSSKIMYAGLLNVIADNLYTVVIGKWYSKSDLGFYSQARRLYEIPVMTLNGIVQNVSYPILASLKNKGGDLMHYYISNIKLVSFISVPLMIYLAVSSEQMIYFLLGQKWIESSVYLQIIALVGLTYNATLVNSNAFKISNRMDIALKIVAIQQVIRITLIFVASGFGVIAIAVSELISSILYYLLTISSTSKLIGYSPTEQVLDILKQISVSFPGLIFYVVVTYSLGIDLFVFLFATSLYFLSYIVLGKRISQKEFMLVQDFIVFFYSKLFRRVKQA